MKAPVGADLTSEPGAFTNSLIVEKMRYYDVALEEKKIKDLGITDAESQWREYENYRIFVKRHPNATVPHNKIKTVAETGPNNTDVEGTRWIRADFVDGESTVTSEYFQTCIKE